MILAIALDAGKEEGRPPKIKVTVTQEGPAAAGRPLRPDQTLVPWASEAPRPPAPLASVPQLEGGDIQRGAQVFASTEAKCSNCHKYRGQGADVGPDLSSLAGRDRREVYRDIAEPSSRVHPDYVSYTVALKDGRVLVGTVKSVEAEAVRVTDTEAKATVVPRTSIEEIRPSATSIMPVGLAGVIGEGRLRDLIAYLTQPTQ
ncbi:MAG: c-type cytochrome [Isosphaeraceae bacterium]